MTFKSIASAGIAPVANIILVSLLVVRVGVVNNDKGVVVFMFYYGLLVLTNLILWLILSLLKSKIRNQIMKITFWLAILFIPLLIIIIMI